ncbi:MAG: hypothetical protein JST54_30115 [Deltaproteobacteria bacterium]|nr:hypothetical protein [Deltaproteobacteria bacterium]
MHTLLACLLSAALTSAAPAPAPSPVAPKVAKPGADPVDALPRLAEDASKARDAAGRGAWQEAQATLAQSGPKLDALRRGVDNEVWLRARSNWVAARLAAAQHDALGAQLAANHLAQDLIELYRDFQPTTLTEAMQLVALLHEVRLQTLAEEPNRARASMATAQLVWFQLRQADTVAHRKPFLLFDAELKDAAMSLGREPEKVRAALSRAIIGATELQQTYFVR